MMKRRALTNKELDAIDRYAAADRSDPFARARAITHTSIGLADGRDKEGNTLGYDADEIKETKHDARGRPFTGTGYRNVKRT